MACTCPFFSAHMLVNCPDPPPSYTETCSASSDETSTVEVEDVEDVEEQGLERHDSSAGRRTEQSTGSLLREEMELWRLLRSDWDTGWYSCTGQARSL